MSNLIYGENPVPDAARPMPVTSYQKQYARMAQTDDARPLQPAYADIAAEMALLETNARANQPAYDRDAAER